MPHLPSLAPSDHPGPRRRRRRWGLAIALLGVAAALLSSCGSRPGQVLDLYNWKLTLPVPAAGSSTAAEVLQPSLDHYSIDPWFRVNRAHNGVVFTANAGGATTGGSGYARSELREMTAHGRSLASWSTTGETSTLHLNEAVTHLPPVKPQLVIAQIHGPSDDLVEVLADGFRGAASNRVGICVRFKGVEASNCLAYRYRLGDAFNLDISVAHGVITVGYAGRTHLTFTNSSSGNYFKAGAYIQSNPSKGDTPSAYGQVVMYQLSFSHH